MNIRIQIITIGNELLEGRILNTNTKYLCKQLYKAGYLPESECSLLDHKKTLQKQLENSLKTFDLVICSGGLGPTQDDITLEVASKIFDSTFYFDEKLFERLNIKYNKRLDSSSIKSFAKVPKKATFFSNHLGLAPGFVFKKGNKRLILLPGVPYEFEHLVDNEVIPYIKNTFPATEKEYKKIIHLYKVAESHLAPFLDTLLLKYNKVDFGIYPNLGILSLHVKTKSDNPTTANKIINPYIKAVKNEFKGKTFESSYETIEESVHHFLISKKLTLSFAESCTGGAFSSTFTKLSGASKYLIGSICAYQNEIKINLLKVAQKTLDHEGAVSEKSVIEMAKGAQKIFGSDISIATSGIAGPLGGTKEKPVGTVFAAICYKNKIISTLKLQLAGNRQTIIKRSINSILAEFWMIRDNL